MADAGYNGGSVVQGTATAVAGARMRRATAEQMHWWLSRGVRAAGASGDSGLRWEGECEVI